MVDDITLNSYRRIGSKGCSFFAGILLCSIDKCGKTNLHEVLNFYGMTSPAIDVPGNFFDKIGV